jgi:hypothetical protein
VHTGEVRSVHAAAAAAHGGDDASAHLPLRRCTLLLSASFDGTVAVSELRLPEAAAAAAPVLHEVTRVRHDDKALCCRWWQPGGSRSPAAPTPLLALPAHFATSGADRRAVVWRLEEQGGESSPPPE